MFYLSYDSESKYCTAHANNTVGHTTHAFKHMYCYLSLTPSFPPPPPPPLLEYIYIYTAVRQFILLLRCTELNCIDSPDPRQVLPETIYGPMARLRVTDAAPPGKSAVQTADRKVRGRRAGGQAAAAAYGSGRGSIGPAKARASMLQVVLIQNQQFLINK